MIAIEARARSECQRRWLDVLEARQPRSTVPHDPRLDVESARNKPAEFDCSRDRNIREVPLTTWPPNRHATSARQPASTIHGSGVTTTRSHFPTIVTDGVAQLFGPSLRERAKRLIAIVHPDFRDELTACARKHHDLQLRQGRDNRGATPGGRTVARFCLTWDFESATIRQHD